MKTTAVLFAIASLVHHPVRAFQNGLLRPSNSIVKSYHALNFQQKLKQSASISFHSTPSSSSSTLSSDNTDGEDETGSKAESILDEFHQSNLPFRIVVIGNGAILETTSKLGPKSKSSISPKSGERLLTFASEDASFEFHVKVEQVCKIAFVATEERRVARFLSENGTPICSLILADKGAEAAGWFDGLVENYGNEVIM